MTQRVTTVETLSMRFRRFRTATALLLASLLVSSCAGSRSGMLLQNRFSRSMNRLVRSSQDLFQGSTGRLTSFSRQAQSLGVDPIRRARGLWTATQATGNALQRRLVRGTAGLPSLTAGLGLDATRRTRHVVRESKKFHPARMLAKFRDESIKLLNSLDLSQPILPGRGDPHLSGDPEVRRRPSFLERLLQRL